METKPVRRRPGRSDASFWRFTVVPAHLAALALFAHLLVAAHTVSHLSQVPPDGSWQHCAICAIGKHSPGIAAAVIGGCHYVASWVAELASPPVARIPDVEGSTLARGPPFSALANIG